MNTHTYIRLLDARQNRSRTPSACDPLCASATSTVFIFCVRIRDWDDNDVIRERENREHKPDKIKKKSETAETAAAEEHSRMDGYTECS